VPELWSHDPCSHGRQVSAQLCGMGYQRPDGSVVRCTYIAGHPDPMDRCSWFGVKAQDEVDAEKGDTDYTPTVIQALLDAMLAGDLDPYIEAVLAAGHTRKRALRGERHEFHIQVRDRVDTPPVRPKSS